MATKGSKGTERETDSTGRRTCRAVGLAEADLRRWVVRGVVNSRSRDLENHSNIISYNLDSIVSQYIPPGTSFQDAIAILNAADATIKQPSSCTYGHQQYFVVAAEFAIKRVFIGSTSALFCTRGRPAEPEGDSRQRCSRPNQLRQFVIVRGHIAA
jgi:hypothetical protein